MKVKGVKGMMLDLALRIALVTFLAFLALQDLERGRVAADTIIILFVLALQVAALGIRLRSIVDAIVEKRRGGYHSCGNRKESERYKRASTPASSTHATPDHPSLSNSSRLSLPPCFPSARGAGLPVSGNETLPSNPRFKVP